MTDLDDLYQEMILDHYKRPRNFGTLEGADRQAEGHNPLCGDRVKIFLKLEDGVVSDIRFQGSGCAISTASASLMTEVLKGKKVEEAEKLFGEFHHLLTDDRGHESPAGAAELGKLAVFSGVREYPVRVKCATLAWHTMHSALVDEKKTVSTE